MKEPGRENGQSILLFAIVLFGLVALTALIIDGGSLYLNRRGAQTAADAAALAGAHELCVEKGSTSDIQNAINQYAVTENGATAVDGTTIDIANMTVEVHTRIETPAFFATVFGYEHDTGRAEASAACFVPNSLAGAEPFAWECGPPVGEPVEDCTTAAIPWTIFQKVLTEKPQAWFETGTNLLDEGDGATSGSYYDGAGGKMAYLVMDSDKFDPEVDCQPSGLINCDLNGDGIDDQISGADRGWLLLDGTGGANEVKQYLVNGYPTPITVPHWFPAKNGKTNGLFDTAQSIRFNVVLVMVVNGICPDTFDDDIEDDCPTQWQAGDLVTAGSGKKTYNRVAGFAPFVPTCITKNDAEHCPIKTYAGVDSKVSTIEGYFVSGYLEGTEIDPDGFDLGVYIISLTE